MIGLWNIIDTYYAIFHLNIQTLRNFPEFDY